MGPWPPAWLAVQPASRRARSRQRELRDARQDLQRAHRCDPRLADRGAPETRGLARRVDGARAPGARRRNRFQRPAGEPALPGRPRATLCPSQGISRGQERRRRRYDRCGARNLCEAGEVGDRVGARTMSYVDANLLEGERMLYRTRLHWKVFVPPILFALVMSVPVAWIALAGTWSAFAWIPPALAALSLIAAFVK